MKFTAVGDILIQRRIPENYEGFSRLKAFIERGDARFFNLETTLNREGECFASQFSGGTYLRAEPEVLSDCQRFGFNMVSFNNNHAMDFSYEGLYSTLEYVEASGLVHAGVGMNLAEASAPKYLETAAGRVALIGVNTSFNPAMLAGEQARRVKGRPGINGLRVKTTYVLPEEDFAKLREIGEKVDINLVKKVEIAEGYSLPEPEGVYTMGEHNFVCGERAETLTEPDPRDMARVEKAIFEARLQADYILISVHTHELSDSTKQRPSRALEIFAHKCIEAGASAVIGHGPHLLRPIEIYRGRPIFYSLGDFFLQLYNVPFAPEEFYAKYGLNSEATVHELLKKRSKDFNIGLMEDSRMRETVIPYWEMEDGELTHLELLPVTLPVEGSKALQGLPQPAGDCEFIERLASMSAPYGTRITLEGGVARCEW